MTTGLSSMYDFHGKDEDSFYTAIEVRNSNPNYSSNSDLKFNP